MSVFALESLALLRYNRYMKDKELLKDSLKLLEVIAVWISKIPEDVELPTMGIQEDWANNVVYRLRREINENL